VSSEEKVQPRDKESEARAEHAPNWAPVPPAHHTRALCAPWRRSRRPVPATARVTAASVLRADDGCFSGHLAAANVAWALDGV
jgi:hypothetical protein